MYLKSLVVFLLCTAFVVAFAVVLNYDATSVGSKLQALPTSPSSCTGSTISCPSFSIVSASLRTMNTTDQLGIANPAYLSLTINISGSSPLVRVELFVGNVSAGTMQGPFLPGLNRIVNLTLPATVVASPGRTYQLSVVGFNAGGEYTMESTYVNDELRTPSG